LNPRPDVFLISIDCLRPDYVGAFNRLSRLTPTLDRILERGAVFTNAVSHAPFTTPAVASLLTGRYPFQTGVRLLLGQVCDPETTTVADAAKRAGYVTAGFPSSFILNSTTGLARGFDEYRDIDDGHFSARGGCWQGGAPLNAALDGFLAAAGCDPVFCWLHYFDLHEYHTDASAPPQSTYTRDLRDKIDAVCIRNLLAILEKHDRMRRAAFIVTADHGECLFQHGVRGHGQHLFDSVLRVPLGIYWPDGEFARHRVIAHQARHIDVLPTLMDFWDLDRDRRLPGESLLQLCAANSRKESVSYAEASPRQLFEGNTAEVRSFQGPEIQALRTDRHKFIRHDDGRIELYDLSADPNEFCNLLTNACGGSSRIAATLSEKLDALSGESPPRGATQPMSTEEASIVRERLRRLGYVSEFATMGVHSTR